MSKPARSQTTTATNTNVMDPMAQDWMKRVFGAADNVGTGPGTNTARDFYSSMMPGANLGMSAMAGDAGAVDSLMNPFQSQVVDQLNSQFENANAMTTKGINDEATKAGAFGGSRHGVAEGVALAQNGDTHDARMADVMSGGYNDAMGRASSLANFGMGGAAGMQQLDPSMMRFMALQQAGQGAPWGSKNTSTTTQPVNRNGAAGVMGGAMTGAQLGGKFGGPWGWGIGAGLGGLMGLFG